MTRREMAKVYCERKGLKVNTATINAFCGGIVSEKIKFLTGLIIGLAAGFWIGGICFLWAAMEKI